MAASCNHVGVIRSGGGCRKCMALVIEKRIPCGGCREEDSPITIWKEGFKRRVFLDGSSVSGANHRQMVPFPDSLAVTSG